MLYDLFQDKESVFYICFFFFFWRWPLSGITLVCSAAGFPFDIYAFTLYKQGLEDEMMGMSRRGCGTSANLKKNVFILSYLPREKTQDSAVSSKYLNASYY